MVWLAGLGEVTSLLARRGSCGRGRPVVAGGASGSVLAGVEEWGACWGGAVRLGCVARWRNLSGLVRWAWNWVWLVVIDGFFGVFFGGF